MSLALQGGRSHGGFIWVVLDASSEDGRLGFEAVTGASAGATNGVVLVDGWVGPRSADPFLASWTMALSPCALPVEMNPRRGGYLGDPALHPLHRGARTRDILPVQINPVERRETPRASEAIQDRLSEISFNASLMRELRAIDVVDGLIAEGQLSRESFEPVLVHRIDGMGELDDHAARRGSMPAGA